MSEKFTAVYRHVTYGYECVVDKEGRTTWREINTSKEMNDLTQKNLEMILAQLKSITMERTNDGNGNPWRVHLYGTYTRDEIRAILHLMDKGVE